MNYDDQRERALTDLQAWVASGQLTVREDILDPQGLIWLLQGDNVGKRMVRL